MKYKKHIKGVCQKCGNFPCSKKHRWCSKCKNEYTRNWRKTHKLSEEQNKKAICRSYANVYQKRGKLKKMNCEICGNENVQKHYTNYSKPLLVKWLCKECHNKIRLS